MKGEYSQMSMSMTSSQMSMTSSQTRIRNKHMWTDEQDKLLVEAMVELFHAGIHRAESGFKPGFLNVLEKKLGLRFSGVTMTNIRSCLKTLKSLLSLYNDIQAKFGFEWDPIKKMTDNKYEKCMKYPFIYFDDMNMIFGKTRANGSGAEDAGDAEDNICNEHFDIDTSMNDVSMGSIRMDDGVSRRSSPMKRTSKKRRNVNVKMFKGLTEAVKKLDDDMKTSALVLASTIAGPHSNMRAKLNGELDKIMDLSMLQCFKLVTHIASNNSLLEIFFSLPDHEKEVFVMELVKTLGF
ncbi:hypothetical protein Droror1_Dr00003426 [Drosera rotundifolia]